MYDYNTPILNQIHYKTIYAIFLPTLSHYSKTPKKIIHLIQINA